MPPTQTYRTTLMNVWFQYHALLRYSIRYVVLAKLYSVLVIVLFLSVVLVSYRNSQLYHVA